MRTKAKSLGPVSRWLYSAIALGAAFGMMAGYAAMFNATSGVFAKAVALEFHWGRSDAALSYAASSLGLAIGSPAVGMLMDRFGARKVILIFSVIFGTSLAAMALQTGSLYLWVAISVVAGISGAGTSVLGYLTVFPQWFDRHLGLAIGVAMCGLGVGTIVMPTLAQALVLAYGWRMTYVFLGCGSILVAFVAVALLREKTKSSTRQLQTGSQDPEQKLFFRNALKSRKLWTICAVFFMAAVATLSLGPHLPALFSDKGFNAVDAAKAASMAGVGLLTGRLLTGILIDKVHAPYIAFSFFLIGAAGLYTLRVSSDYRILLMATTCIGLSIGAEGDLISYLVRSYFGTRSFGSLYGIAYSIYALGVVIGPIGVGRFFDAHGSYDLALIILPCILVFSGVLVLTLGRYQRLGSQSGDEASDLLGFATT